LFICIISIVVSLLFVVPNQKLKANFKLFLALGFVALIIYLFVPLDLNANYLSTLGSRLQESDNASSAGGRTGRWMSSINNLFTKPLGWNLNEFGYAHNLWLDVARFGGLIPLSILLIFTFRSIGKIVKLATINSEQLFFNTLLIAYTTATFLMFFVEPIMDSLNLFYFFTTFCLLQGIINGISKKFTIKSLV
jgi:hypothetical protein